MELAERMARIQPVAWDPWGWHIHAPEASVRSSQKLAALSLPNLLVELRSCTR